MSRRNIIFVFSVMIILLLLITPLSFGFSYYARPIIFHIPLYEGYTDGVVLYDPLGSPITISMSCRVNASINVSVIQGSSIQSFILTSNSSRTISVNSRTIYIVFHVVSTPKWYMLGETINISVRRILW